jgi:hypothetical protein
MNAYIICDFIIPAVLVILFCVFFSDDGNLQGQAYLQRLEWTVVNKEANLQ